MPPIDHFDDVAAGIAPLPEGDAERLAAREHAAGCERCAKALREAEQLLVFLDEARPSAPSPEALERVARGVLAHMAARPRRAWIRPVPAVLAAWVGVLVLAKSRAHAPGPWIESAAVLALAVAVAAAAWRARVAALAAAVLGSMVLASVTGTTGGLALMHGLKCFTLELVAAALPYGALVFAAMQRRVVAHPLTFAVIAAAGALAGQGALQITCPERAHTPHLFATHVAGLVTAALLGALGRRWVARAVADRHA